MFCVFAGRPFWEPRVTFRLYVDALRPSCSASRYFIREGLVSISIPVDASAIDTDDPIEMAKLRYVSPPLLPLLLFLLLN